MICCWLSALPTSQNLKGNRGLLALSYMCRCPWRNTFQVRPSWEALLLTVLVSLKPMLWGTCCLSRPTRAILVISDFREADFRGERAGEEHSHLQYYTFVLSQIFNELNSWNLDKKNVFKGIHIVFGITDVTSFWWLNSQEICWYNWFEFVAMGYLFCNSCDFNFLYFISYCLEFQYQSDLEYIFLNLGCFIMIIIILVIA